METPQALPVARPNYNQMKLASIGLGLLAGIVYTGLKLVSADSDMGKGLPAVASILGLRALMPMLFDHYLGKTEFQDPKLMKKLRWVSLAEASFVGFSVWSLFQLGCDSLTQWSKCPIFDAERVQTGLCVTLVLFAIVNIRYFLIRRKIAQEESLGSIAITPKNF